MRIDEQINKLVTQLGSSQISGAAYDTAWYAHLIELDNSMGYHALEWLRENQLADGSWGGSINYSHDRIICTLAAMIALKKWGDEKDKERIRKARIGLDIAFRRLSTDIVGATAGFELVVPLLLEEAFEIGAIRRRSDRTLKTWCQHFTDDYDGQRRDDFHAVQMAKGREMKLKAIEIIDREVTTAFSAEMVGDELHLLDVDNLQEENGSVGCSPSATAFFAINVKYGDKKALDYLSDVAQKYGLSNGGGIPEFVPFDIYQISWVLWNLALAGIDYNLMDEFNPYLDFLVESWSPDGVSYSSQYTPKDGDDTFLTYDALKRYGRSVDLDAVLRYEEDDHFRCFQYELNPSITANIHALGALKEAGYEVNHPKIIKIVDFLKKNIQVQTFWIDKWHISPYYATSQMIIAVAGFADEKFNDLIINAIDWIVDSQYQEGAWGYYRPTVEETALCLQALFIWQRQGGNVPEEVLKKGINWLLENQYRPYEPFWICKCLYTPILIVRSIVLSALKLGEHLY
jgi:halimadienyl-diphosphate synthase